MTLEFFFFACSFSLLILIFLSFRLDRTMLTLAPVVVALGGVGSEIGLISYSVHPQVNGKSQEKVHVCTAQKPEILLSVARSSHILAAERIPKLVAILLA
jgi:hypothetical protein